MDLKEKWAELIDSPLREGLLPIAQVRAPFAEGSAMKTIGKVPSFYNAKGEIIGYADWTRRDPTDRDLAAWSADTRLGIGMRARNLRAFDVDVDDPVLAESIRDTLLSMLQAGTNTAVPYRYRNNSSRVLFPFWYSGELPRRRYKFEGGDMVEVLGDNQQWVAYGVHPSGEEYRWEGGSLVDAPFLTASQLDEIGAVFTTVFGATEGSEALKERKSGQSVAVDDPVADFLIAKGWVLGERDDALIIRCPNAASHTTGADGDGSTLWYRAGSNGYEQGHFKCLHAHCADIGDAEFLKRIGYQEPDVSKDFDVVPVDKDVNLRRLKNGKFVSDLPNIVLALDTPETFGVSVAYDTFIQAEVIQWAGQPWRPMIDADEAKIRLALMERGFSSISKQDVHDAIAITSRSNVFDSAQRWLDSLPAWDGVPRCKRFFALYCGADDSAAAGSIAQYLWTGLVGRILSPGIKADTMVVLQGNQGVGKSSLVRALAPNPDWYAEVSFSWADTAIYRQTKGKVIVEAAELAGLGKRDIESMKAFLSRQVDRYAGKWKERAEDFPRRYMVIGTTNDDFFLTDVENRRYAILHVRKISIDAIRRDLDQLYAEAKLMYAENGVMWHGLTALLEGENENYRVEDPWGEDITVYLCAQFSENGNLPDRVPLTASQILKLAIGARAKDNGQKDVQRVGRLMRVLGYTPKRVRQNGKVVQNFELRK